jgi:hypothetical protein
VLIHQGLHCSCSSNRDKAQASNFASNSRPIFWQRGIAVFAASFCHAKITPAALQRGEFSGPLRRGRRSSWTQAEIPTARFSAHRFRAVLPIAETLWMAPS